MFSQGFLENLKCFHRGFVKPQCFHRIDILYGALLRSFASPLPIGFTKPLTLGFWKAHCYGAIFMLRITLYAQICTESHLSNLPSYGDEVEVGVKFKNIFPKNRLKCPDLHRKIMHGTPPLEGLRSRGQFKSLWLGSK